jgi:hypothetical protein
VAVGAVRTALETATSLGLVRFVLFSEVDLVAYRTALEALPG